MATDEERGTLRDTLMLLAELWLREPDAALLARAQRTLGLPSAAPSDLAIAYVDVLLNSVYPYGTSFTDAWGEINTPEAEQMYVWFAECGFDSPALRNVGAPDHIGVCLQFLAHTLGAPCVSFNTRLLRWAPVLCVAVTREPGAHPFYKALAERTCDGLLRLNLSPDHRWPDAPRPDPIPPPIGGGADTDEDREVRLEDIARFVLIAERSGMFLSRARLGYLANRLDMRLPFLPRFDLGELLFVSAGASGRLEDLLALLEEEIAGWRAAYAVLAQAWPAWATCAQSWQARLDNSAALLKAMRRMRPSEAM